MAGVKGRSGGARVGAGRKRRDPKASWLAGEGPKAGPKLVPPAVGEAPAAVPVAVARPKGLSAEDGAVWDEIAPLALEQGTLTVATAMAFADLCAYIVLERKLRLSPLGCAGPDHRGMVKQVEILRARFRLIADGKPAAAPEQPKDAWSEFDGPRLVQARA